jgi:hypothetical protein
VLHFVLESAHNDYNAHVLVPWSYEIASSFYPPMKVRNGDTEGRFERSIETK